jgi:hypothetical protein
MQFFHLNNQGEAAENDGDGRRRGGGGGMLMMRRMCVDSVQWPGKTTRRSTIPMRAVAVSSTCTRSVYWSGLITAMRDDVRYTSCVCVARDSGCFSVYLSCSWSGLRYEINIRKISLLRIWCDTLWISHYDQQKAQQHLVTFVYLADLALSGFPFGPILCAHVSLIWCSEWKIVGFNLSSKWTKGVLQAEKHIGFVYPPLQSTKWLF